MYIHRFFGRYAVLYQSMLEYLNLYTCILYYTMTLCTHKGCLIPNFKQNTHIPQIQISRVSTNRYKLNKTRHETQKQFASDHFRISPTTKSIQSSFRD